MDKNVQKGAQGLNYVILLTSYSLTRCCLLKYCINIRPAIVLLVWYQQRLINFVNNKRRD